MIILAGLRQDLNKFLIETQALKQENAIFRYKYDHTGNAERFNWNKVIC